MEKNNRDDSVRKDLQDTQQFQAADAGTDRNIEKKEQGDNELRERGSSNTNNDSSNEPYSSDGDTTLRKKDPNNPADWRESDAPNPSKETSGWQSSNDSDDTIREPEGTYTTGERGNVINSATWDPESHLREEDVGHVDVNDYTQNTSPESQTKEQQVKHSEEPVNVNKDRVQKEK